MKKLSTILSLCAVLLLASCQKEQPEEPRTDGFTCTLENAGTSFNTEWSTTSLEIPIEKLTAASGDKISKVEWRINAGESIKEEDLTMRIPLTKNITAQVADYSIEIYSGIEWIEVAVIRQGSGLLNIDGVEWTLGNLQVSEAADKSYYFDLAASQSESGDYFNYMSSYAVKAEGDSYSGTAYKPEPTQIALGDIPTDGIDPCSLVGDGSLRMPAVTEQELLFAKIDEGLATLNDISGVSFNNGILFLPLAGGCLLEDGSIFAAGTNGGYWSIGQGFTSDGMVMAISSDYSVIAENAELSMASIRCVRDRALPEYVSVEPKQAPSNEAFEVVVTTKAGDFEEYPVELFPYTGSPIKKMATKENPVVTFSIDKNDSYSTRSYELFVNGSLIKDVLIEQQGITNYAEYVSHTPSEATADAFTLAVKCKSDMTEFPVKLVCSDGSEMSQNGSSSVLTVNFEIGANESGEDRTYSIFVNGVDTEQSVTQLKAEVVSGFNVEWSSGYLTVKDGAYAFAEPAERGLYFQYMSKYGMKLNIADDEKPATSSKYSGESYAPEQTTIAYGDITNEDVDPCSLVAPANTWRMPNADEFTDLLSYEFELESGAYRKYSDGTQDVYLAPSGSIKDSGVGVLGTTFVRIWVYSAEPVDGKYYTVSGGLSSATSAFSANKIKATPNSGMMVRCVRDK